MSGIEFSIEGQALTAEQVAAIKARQQEKQRTLALARSEREASSKERHSHVGAELAYVLRSAPVILGKTVYDSLAELSNTLYQEDQPAAGQIVGALALGMQRALHQQESQGTGLATPRPSVTPEEQAAAMAAVAENAGGVTVVPRMPGANAAPAELAPEGDPQGLEDSPQAEPDDAAPAGFLEAQARQQGITVAELVKRLEQGTPVTGTAVINGMTDPEDGGAAAEPAPSPQPQETQGAKEARARRAAKRQQT